MEFHTTMTVTKKIYDGLAQGLYNSDNFKSFMETREDSSLVRPKTDSQYPITENGDVFYIYHMQNVTIDFNTRPSFKPKAKVTLHGESDAISAVEVIILEEAEKTKYKPKKNKTMAKIKDRVKKLMDAF